MVALHTFRSNRTHRLHLTNEVTALCGQSAYTYRPKYLHLATKVPTLTEPSVYTSLIHSQMGIQ